MAKFIINQKEYEADVPADMPLLWVLRDVIGLTGNKVWLRYGPVRRLYGATSMARLFRSCVTLVSRAEGQKNHGPLKDCRQIQIMPCNVPGWKKMCRSVVIARAAS